MNQISLSGLRNGTGQAWSKSEIRFVLISPEILEFKNLPDLNSSELNESDLTWTERKIKSCNYNIRWPENLSGYWFSGRIRSQLISDQVKIIYTDFRSSWTRAVPSLNFCFKLKKIQKKIRLFDILRLRKVWTTPLFT